MSDTRFPVLLDGPGNHVDDPRELLVGYLDWYREALVRKTAGLSEEQLRSPVDGLGWAPLGLVRHLGWVERRWIRWGFAAEQVAPCPPGEDDAEWRVGALSTEQVWRAYRAEVAHTRGIVAGVPLSRRAALGGRFHAARTRRRWAGSCSTCSRSTPGTWVSSTWLDSCSTGSPASDRASRTDRGAPPGGNCERGEKRRGHADFSA